jgi:hypothetical protein
VYSTVSPRKGRASTLFEEIFADLERQEFIGEWAAFRARSPKTIL